MPEVAFTFDPQLADDLSKVRWLIGDIDSGSPLLDDNSITAVLSSEGSVRGAAISCLQTLEARFAQVTESRAGETLADKTAVSNKYRDIKRRIMKMATPGWSVLTQSTKDTYNEDTDLLTNGIVRNGFDD